MVIFQDTREQTPLDFSSYSCVEEVAKATLPFGDYACKHNNQKIPFVFERKSLGDLFSTLGKGHDRFRRELNRATEENVTIIIIIEANLTKILKGHKHSKMQGISIIRILLTLMLKYKIPFVACSGRKEMELFIVEFYTSYIKNIM